MKHVLAQATKSAPSQYPLYIFDLDGTMALTEHRNHLVQAPVIPDRVKGGMKKIADFKPDWPAFYAACIKDAPNWPVIGTFIQLYSVGCDIRIWSGRESTVRAATVEWLSAYTGMLPVALEKILTMRPEGDFTPDDQLKKKWLNALTPQERGRIAAVFDDRNKVVDMWRKNGLTCFQVAPGDF